MGIPWETYMDISIKKPVTTILSEIRSTSPIDTEREKGVLVLQVRDSLAPWETLGDNR